jgi:hypothetical protein
MIMVARIGLVLLVAIAALVCVEVDGQERWIPRELSFVRSAEAVVGRPLTPVSVAGVARRTARRH